MKTFNALILKKRNYRENDLIVTFLSEFGLDECIAKSASKVSSKKNSQIDILNLVKVTVVDGKVNKILTEVKIIDSYTEFKSKENIFVCWIFAECLERLYINIDTEVIKFEEILNILTTYKDSSRDIFIALTQILLLILRKSGFHIEFKNYFDTRSEILPCQIRYFSFLDNTLGFNEFQSIQSKLPINDEQYKVLKYLYQDETLSLKNKKLFFATGDNTLFKDLFHICVEWVENITSSVIKSKKLLFCV